MRIEHPSSTKTPLEDLRSSCISSSPQDKKRFSFLSSDADCLLQGLVEHYLLAIPPLQKRWILVPHLSWKLWLERQITNQIGALTSCVITTTDALITSFSMTREAILSPGEIALLCHSFPSQLEAFFGHTPSFAEVQKMGKLLFELGYVDENQLLLRLQEEPALLFFYEELYLRAISSKALKALPNLFSPWSRKLKSPLSLNSPIALFQVTELPSHFVHSYEGDLLSFCLEPSPHFWADELACKKRGDALLPDFIMQFGQVRKTRMKQILDFDMEIQQEFPHKDLPSASSLALSSLKLVRNGLSELDHHLIREGLQNALIEQDLPSSPALEIALMGSPLEEARSTAEWIASTINACNHQSHEREPSNISYLQSNLLDEIAIFIPASRSQEYASLLAVEFARVSPKIPVSFEGIALIKGKEALFSNWLNLLSPVQNGKISSLIVSNEFFDLFAIEQKDRSSLGEIFSAFTKREEMLSLQKSDEKSQSLREKYDLLNFLIATIEKELFSYQGNQEFMEQFLMKLLHLSSSLAPWIGYLQKNESKPLLAWHALLQESAREFFQDTLSFENPLSTLIEKAKSQWNLPIHCQAMLCFCSSNPLNGDSNSKRGLIRIRPFSSSSITPAKIIFLLGMSPEYGALSNQVFPWILSKERLSAKTPSASLEKDTLLDLFLLAKEKIVITSSKEELLKESPLIRSILSSIGCQLNEVLKRPAFPKRSQHTIKSISLPQTVEMKKESPLIDLADLLLFAHNPLRYSLSKHLTHLPHCPDRKRQVEESFEGKTIKPYELLKLSRGELLQKQEEQQKQKRSRDGLLGAVAARKSAPFLDVQSFITEGRFDAHFSPLQGESSWHSSSLLLHPPLSSQNDSGNKIELRGFIEGMHREGILLFQDPSSHLVEMIEKWPLFLVQTILSRASSLKAPRWIALPTLDSTSCKTDLHSSDEINACFDHLITLYQKAQKSPCLYIPEWIEAVLQNGSLLLELFQEEVANSLGTTNFGVPSNRRSLALAFGAEKEWFEEALAVDFTLDLKGVYSPFFESIQKGNA